MGALSTEGLKGLNGIVQTGEGGGGPLPPGDFEHSLDYSDARNSFYLGTPGAW